MKVLVALDESPISLRAAREAHRLFATAEFLVINVGRNAAPWLAMGDFGMVAATDVATLPTEGIDDATLSEMAHEAGIDVTEILHPIGDPAHVICLAADEHDVDVVVVGSHDKGVLRRLVDPSVAQAVVQGTYRPVLVVSGLPPTA